ncbi:sulfatase-like hydrolase/transferase [Nonomuraea sp. K274]|uniref:Sulfatase-like hydrolase/transferase n=1 Tax=Nonomuraea cypriaca TaxID=1187855 RepID=A0A931AE27_9ACTN|nr:sulfatase-like hydrolase/transferase [Nonomuraea cypriaca]MBF8190213.1 sulfatase-like hydrolase/transferase [Nonomuraea cypriaca]
MTRTRAGVLAAGLLAACLTGVPAEAATPPNIVLVVADDLGYDQTSLYGRPGAIATPNLEAIGDDGVRVTQGYVASPVCSPSRSALLTGLEPARAGADSNHLTRARPERMPTDTIMKALPAAYTSAAIGKWDLAGGQPFDANHLPAAMGFDDFYGFFGGMHAYCPGTALKQYDRATQTYANRTSTRYLTQEFTDHAVDYIGDHAANPFFLYLAYNAPHTPLETPTSCAGGAQQSDQERFAEMVRTMDDGIGQVRQALEDNGIADSTLLVFLSDNGQQLGFFTGATRGGKYDLFEGGIKVPFALTWPAALPAGVTYQDPVSGLDLRPTLLAAAGSAGAPPAGASGVDLTPYLTGERTGRPHTQLSWRYVVDKAEQGHQGTVIAAQRSGDLKWISSTSPAPATTTNYLFDLATNPSEADGQNLWPVPAVSGPVLAAHHAWNAANRVTESFKNPRGPADVRANLPDGYLEAGGTWSVVDVGDDKSYQGTSTGAVGRSMLETSYFADVKASTSVRLMDPGQAGLIVRGSGAGESFTGYAALIAAPQNGSACAGPAPQPGGGSARVVLTKVVNGAGTQVACEDVPLTPDADHNLVVRAVGSDVSISLDGTQQLTWSDPAAFPGGRVGLRVAGTTQTVRARFGTLNGVSCSGACP